MSSDATLTGFRSSRRARPGGGVPATRLATMRTARPHQIKMGITSRRRRVSHGEPAGLDFARSDAVVDRDGRLDLPVAHSTRATGSSDVRSNRAKSMGQCWSERDELGRACDGAAHHEGAECTEQGNIRQGEANETCAS